ncbi:hypothetical protein HanXRQr2_Chr11g0518451 [Helianthus annuus]|uniref:Uncharacterized protein n=1 Tax=Helianthus annuus TaxID=4232 RepID=A0A9K3HU41_HELAN|nr:hypothetical protein HanXRQr2_Chr11g0518451 [Helianthus annuus]
MPPRRPPRRNTRTNHERNNTSSNETPVDPNIINAINQAVAGLLPNLVTQTAEAVIQQTRHPERTNTNLTSSGEIRENTTNNITYSIDIWISKFQKQNCEDAMDGIAETPRVRRFIPVDSPWHRLFDLAHTPTYRELLVEFLSSFTFYPPGVPVPLPHPGAPPPPEVSFRLAGVMGSMTLAEFAVHCGLYMQEEIETEIYTAGLVVVEKPILVGFWQVIAGADHWEHDKSKGRVSFVRDPLYRRPCALAHGLAQYYASAHHRQERGFLYGGAYVTVIARSLGLVPHQDPHLRTPPVMPTRMGFQTLWGMKVIKRFAVGPRFKNRDGGVWTE